MAQRDRNWALLRDKERAWDHDFIWFPYFHPYFHPKFHPFLHPFPHPFLQFGYNVTHHSTRRCRNRCLLAVELRSLGQALDDDLISWPRLTKNEDFTICRRKNLKNKGIEVDLGWWTWFNYHQEWGFRWISHDLTWFNYKKLGISPTKTKMKSQQELASRSLRFATTSVSSRNFLKPALLGTLLDSWIRAAPLSMTKEHDWLIYLVNIWLICVNINGYYMVNDG